MSGVDFIVLEVFDLAGRAGLLVTGTLLSGDVKGGAVLRVGPENRPVHVLGIELAGNSFGGRMTLIVDRRDGDLLAKGCHLVGD